jgi:hypothetical protein
MVAALEAGVAWMVNGYTGTSGEFAAVSPNQ